MAPRRGLRRPSLIEVLALGALVAVILRSAWISDDAYISFRSVFNLLHGYGLRWNVDERVQVFTHPLWLALTAGLSALGLDPYDAALLLGVSLSVAAAASMQRGARSRAAGLLVVGTLASSKAFIDYSTSGLENPLSHLLIALFVGLWSREGRSSAEGSVRRLGGATLLSSLLVLCHPDLVLIVGPPLLWWSHRLGRRALRPLLVGALPLLAWEFFAVIYYGSFLPNPAFAKLHHSYPRSALLRAGLRYMLDSWRLDPVTIPLLLLGLAVAARDRRLRPLAVGLVAYVSYVAWIGGDFMSGRFLSVPFVLSVALLGRRIGRWVLVTEQPDPAPPGREVAPRPGKTPAGPQRVAAGHVARPLRRIGSRARGGMVLLAVPVLVGLAARSPRAPLRSGADYGTRFEGSALDPKSGVADERAVYFSQTGLLRGEPLAARYPVVAPAEVPPPPSSPLRVPALFGDRPGGMIPYSRGPMEHVVDPQAITDPLLARLPAPVHGAFRAGHLGRPLPEGYLNSLMSGEPRISDPEIAALYRDVRLASSAPLLASGRLGAIWRLNTGHRYLSGGADAHDRPAASEGGDPGPLLQAR